MSAFPSMDSWSQNGGALIASASSVLRRQVLDRLHGRCHPVQQASGGADALEKLQKGSWQLLFVDRRLPDLDASEVIAISQRRFPDIQVVVLDSERDAVSMREKNANRQPAMTCAPESDSHADGARFEPLPGMIGSSTAMRQVYRMVRLVAPRPTTVLIAGPTGTGKELVARALHMLSPRSAKPLVIVNCAAIPETLLESELFGYARGAFTGAVQAQVGRIPAAHGGTLFLDEISELPLGMQGKLLRFLEQKEIQRLGTSESMRVDVRIIAASNVDLAARAMRGQFRQDLYYRLSTFPIELPPLAARQEDILPLAENFLACMSAAMEMRTPQLSPEAARVLQSHSWSGNVRELQHVIERASILVENNDSIRPEHIYFPEAQHCENLKLVIPSEVTKP